MSIKVMSAVWENGPADSTQRFVLLALADNASDDGGNAYPSIAEIAKKCAVSERTVIRAIDSLTKAGYLIKRRRRDTSNMYQIVLSRLVSDKLSYTEVTECHPVSDNVSPSNVTQDHMTPDTVSHDPSFNHPTNHYDDSPATIAAPISDLLGHFHKTTTFLGDPRKPRFKSLWVDPLERILELTNGNVDEAKALITASVEKAWSTKDRKGEPFIVHTPKSIITFASNLAATGKATATAADDDSLWQRAIQAITRREYTDERLKAAIRAIGGTGRIASASDHDAANLKRQLGAAYRRALAPTV